MNKQKKLLYLASFFSKKPDKLIKELTLFYSKYGNGEKITTLLIIWLFQYHYFCLTYESYKNFKKFLKSKKSILLNAEKISSNNFDIITLKENFFFRVISLCIANCFNQFFSRGYAYDKNKPLSKYYSHIVRFFLRYLPSSSDQTKKKDLVNILSNYLCDRDLKYLKISLPEVFFSKEIRLLSTSKKYIKMCVNAFWDFDGYEKILLIRNKIFIDNFQHGGGYELKNDFMKFSEELLSDHYWFWGFGNLNIIQHRYKKSKKNYFKKNYKINRILWIERGNLPEIYKYIYPDAFKEIRDIKVINFIEDELKKYKKLKFRIPYQSRLSNLYKRSSIKIILDKRKPEKIIQNDDLIIFDHINHSLIYFCLCRDIPFLCVMDLKKYSKNYNKDYIDFLNYKNVIIDCSNKSSKTTLKKFEKFLR